ncbi:unnamed protein product [Tilletia controversa]|uniref:CFEM domain-containing protein n=3 Tax=Tilletia TaxID=13289 RepID=A0A8X7SX11_9BASI|nr:hypothetical protein CF336_g4292 [Tilletia laevis]KAE8197439.1 hypothetical protein CF328_g3847 [Tilletia controversa]KAE8257029.1 hypothetical protein A4X03_0g4818 [Tilletia caries]KAE8202356.1 hypothetical protein CF335_g3451 [Tilletia laevis]KAE8247416.1 hypothetical protein A4X06_0g4471 [Tilletia controversa]
MRFSVVFIALALATGSVLAQKSPYPTETPDLALLATCGKNCTVSAAKEVGCKGEKDLACWCKSDKFGKHAAECITKDCAPALPFAYSRLQQACEAANQKATFKWPNATTAASDAAGAATNTTEGAGDATPGQDPATETSTTEQTPTELNPPAGAPMGGMTNMNEPAAPAAPATSMKSGAGLAVDFVWPAIVGAAAFSAGVVVVL